MSSFLIRLTLLKTHVILEARRVKTPLNLWQNECVNCKVLVWMSPPLEQSLNGSRKTSQSTFTPLLPPLPTTQLLWYLLCPLYPQRHQTASHFKAFHPPSFHQPLHHWRHLRQPTLNCLHHILSSRHQISAPPLLPTLHYLILLVQNTHP